jgi:hypothetical protein
VVERTKEIAKEIAEKKDRKETQMKAVRTLLLLFSRGHEGGRGEKQQ